MIAVDYRVTVSCQSDAANVTRAGDFQQRWENNINVTVQLYD